MKGKAGKGEGRDCPSSPFVLKSVLLVSIHGISTSSCNNESVHPPPANCGFRIPRLYYALSVDATTRCFGGVFCECID